MRMTKIDLNLSGKMSRSNKRLRMEVRESPKNPSILKMIEEDTADAFSFKPFRKKKNAPAKTMILQRNAVTKCPRLKRPNDERSILGGARSSSSVLFGFSFIKTGSEISVKDE